LPAKEFKHIGIPNKETTKAAVLVVSLFIKEQNQVV